MDWDIGAALAELLGAISVLATLVFRLSYSESISFNPLHTQNRLIVYSKFGNRGLSGGSAWC